VFRSLINPAPKLEFYDLLEDVKSGGKVGRREMVERQTFAFATSQSSSRFAFSFLFVFIYCVIRAKGSKTGEKEPAQGKGKCRKNTTNFYFIQVFSH
jgi:hypothetical protein